jgi:hypothetical protein
MPQTRFWVTRLGHDAEFSETCREGGYVAIGWNELGNLKWLLREDSISAEKKLFNLYRKWGKRWGENAKTQTTNVHQIIRFVREIKEDDIVLSPTPHRTYLVGRRVGDYEYARKKDNCRYKHRRTIEWDDKEIRRDDLSDGLQKTLNGQIPVFRVNRHDDELYAILHGKPYKSAEVTLQQRKTEESLVGKPINFRGLIYAPVNEQGVVFLFAKVSKDLGFEIEQIKSGFPDAIGRVATPKGLAPRKIEFEYKSSGYQEHLPEKCDIIVCWEDDWEQRPIEIEVVELKTLVEDLRKRE